MKATESITDTAQRSSRRSSIIAIMAVLFVFALSACGGSDDTSSGASEQATSSQPDEPADEETDATPASSVDLSPVFDCIAAADIVVAETSYSENYLAEQKIAATLDLGALGNEFGGGQLFYFESVDRATEMAANLADGTEAAVRQDGVIVVQYSSAVQDEAADIVMACATQ